MAEKMEGEVEMENIQVQNKLKERKISWAKLRRVDSLNLEAGRVSNMSHIHSTKIDWRSTLSLAFQSIGVVYGDIGTSPLYVYSSTFNGKIKEKEDIFGVLSLILYTLLLLPLIKYVFVVLYANDNGNGGNFALYSKLIRYVKVGLIPNDQPEDMQLSNYSLKIPSNRLKRAEKVKEVLEKNKNIHILLFLITILGTSMVMGDGILTPCISVLSAVSGINSLGQNAVVGISIAILIMLFSVQRFGTDKVGFSFAPIICLWFSFIGGIGLYNLFKYNVGVLRAVYPKYIFDYFRRNGKQGWISLGGVVLCVTGTEAMFADLGHFNVRAIQISFSSIVLPALLAAYSGQAAYLTEFPEHVPHTFYKSIPDPLYWPMFVIAVAAAIIASQAMISGAFQIISQSLSLGCFPRVRIVHTSVKYEGQVYIPEINYLFMIACVLVCWGFKSTDKIGNAYGIAVVSDMVITTHMVTLIMLVVWKKSIWWIIAFYVGFFSVESVYVSSVYYKFKDGGFLPLTIALFLMTIKGIWHYVHKEKYMYELNNKVSSEFIRDLASNRSVNRMPGIGLLYSELVQGIPPIFPHFVQNIPSLHSVLVFVSIKSLSIGKVAPEERFLFRQVEPREYRTFRCVVRYGYQDAIEETSEFERQLVEGLKEFIRQEGFISEAANNNETVATEAENSSIVIVKDGKERAATSAVHVEDHTSRISSASIRSFNSSRLSSNKITCAQVQGNAEEEMQFVQKAMEKGVVYLLGESEVVAKSNSSLVKKFVVNYAYSFLRKNFRQGDKALSIPRSRLLRVGMTYEI